MENTMALTSNAAKMLNGSDEAEEARWAFLEKREPVFRRAVIPPRQPVENVDTSESQ